MDRGDGVSETDGEVFEETDEGEVVVVENEDDKISFEMRFESGSCWMRGGMFVCRVISRQAESSGRCSRQSLESMQVRPPC